MSRRNTTLSLVAPGGAGTDRDSGFSLIELLVVMVIIGTLAAIAVPVFLNQRSKAHDTSTKADVSNLGKEVGTYFVDGAGSLSLDFAATPGKVLLTDGAAYTTTVNLTNGTARPTSGVSSHLDDESGWCVALTDPKGSVKEYRYTAKSGLEEGTC